jgi:hypothetical protein
MKTPEESLAEEHVVAFLKARGSNNVDVFTAMPAIADAIREAVQEETRRIMALAEYTRAVGFVKSKGSEEAELPFSAIMALSAAKA